MLLHWAPHALSALAQTAVWKSVSNKFGAGLACDHEPRRSHDCHSAPGLPQQPRQICTGFTALTTSAARTNYRTVSGTCRNKALTQKGCLVSAGLYYLFFFFVSFVVGVKLNSRRCTSFCKESTFRRHKACCELTWIFIRILVKIVTQLQECTQDWHGGENLRILHVELWGTCVCVSTGWFSFPLRTVILDNLRKSGFIHDKNVSVSF